MTAYTQECGFLIDQVKLHGCRNKITFYLITTPISLSAKLFGVSCQWAPLIPHASLSTEVKLNPKQLIWAD